MKNHLKYLGISLLTIIISVSCAKETPIYDEEAPLITINAPIEGATFPAGATVALEVDIQENLDLHQYSAVLRSSTSEVAFTIESGHVHGKSFVIDKEFELPTGDNQTYTITIKANDHDDNLRTESVTIYTN